MSMGTSNESPGPDRDVLVMEHKDDEYETLLRYPPDLVSWTFSGTCDKHKPILLDATNPGRFVSIANADSLVSRLCRAFEPYTTVCLHLANDVTYPVLVLAILASKCRWTGTNPAYTATELEHHFRISETTYVIVAEDRLEVVQAAVKSSGTKAEIIIFTDLLGDYVGSISSRVDSIHNGECWPTAVSDADTKRQNFRTLHDLLSDNASDDWRHAVQDIDADSIAVLMQTSGTTGLPKMAIRTHKSLVLEQQAIEDNNTEKSYEVRRLFSTPVFHGFAFPEMSFNSLRLGQVSYFMRRFDDSFAQKIHDFGITETFGAPTMLLSLVNKPHQHHLLQSLRMIAFGGAPLMPELRLKTQAMLNDAVRIVPVYGMTEAGWLTTMKYPECDETGSVGRPILGIEIKVAKKENIAFLAGQPVGELLVKGPQLMRGYYGSSTATAEAFEGGFLKTGDIGYVKDGKVYLVDRAKDLIKVNAWQVAPTELENVLLQSEDVQDAAVFGVGQGVHEHPVACVIPATSNVTDTAIREHMLSKLTGYKVNRCEVKFVKEIPRSPAGKILKARLRAEYVDL